MCVGRGREKKRGDSGVRGRRAISTRRRILRGKLRARMKPTKYLPNDQPIRYVRLKGVEPAVGDDLKLAPVIDNNRNYK